MVWREGDAPGIGWVNKYGSLPDPLSGGEHTWVTLIEVKMCPNTDPSQQLSRADGQHADLEALLTASINGRGGVTRTSILVGHFGTLFKEHSLETLMSLEVDRASALKAKPTAWLATTCTQL